MPSKTAVFAAALALNACVPFPNRALFAPEVSGTLTRAGAPVAGAEILLTGIFTKRMAAVTTDGTGRFKLGPLTELNLTRNLLGDRVYKYSLTVKLPGEGEFRAFEGSALGAPPDPLVLSCDLDRLGVRSKRPGFCVDLKGRQEGK